MDAEIAFEEARLLLNHSGHKIFDASRMYFRTKPVLIAVRPPAYKQKLSVYVVRVIRGRLEIGWLQPDCGDRSIRTELKEKCGKIVKERPRLFSNIRGEDWLDIKRLIVKTQHEEFDLLITDTQLS